MALDLFAGIPVTDYAAALPWYEQFFGGKPSFLPNDIEAVWEVAENATSTSCRTRIGQGTPWCCRSSTTSTTGSPDLSTGHRPAKRETYDGGVTKVIYRDAEGNEISFGGVPG